MTTLATDKPWMLPATWQPNQFHHLNRFIVVNRNRKTAVEGTYSKIAADNACETCNAHAAEHGHPEVYEVWPLPSRLHNQPPQLWDTIA